MNIFKILSEGDGKIHEPSISAFLGFLLNPNELHGLGSKLLENIIEPIISNSESKPLKDEFLIKVHKSVKFVDLSNRSNYNIYISLEEGFEISKNNQCYIDVFIRICDKEDNLKLLICIENKIKDDSLDTKEQLINEIKGVKNKFGSIDTVFIFLVPKSTPKATEVFNSFKKGLEGIDTNAIPAMVCWNDVSEGISVYRIIRDLLKKEVEGEIEPIDHYSKHTIKALLNFINTDFKTYIEEKRDNDSHAIVKFENFEDCKKYMLTTKRYTNEVMGVIEEIYNYCENKKKESGLNFTYNFNRTYINVKHENTYLLHLRRSTEKCVGLELLASYNGKKTSFIDKYKAHFEWAGAVIEPKLRTRDDFTDELKKYIDESFELGTGVTFKK